MKKLLLSLSTLFILSSYAGTPGTSEMPGYSVKHVTAAGEALSFDGTDDYLKTTGYTTFSEYTFEGWFKLNNLTNQALIIGTNNSGPASTFSQCLFLQSGNFIHYLWDGSSKQISSTVQPTVGVWYHVAISAKNNGQMKIQVNSTETVSSFSIGTVWNGLTSIVYGQPTNPYNYFNGTMDEIRVWNRQLCSSEINNNMNGEIATTANGLITNYHFNQGVGGANNTIPLTINTATDASGFNKTGSLLNFSLNGTVSNWTEPSTIVSGTTVTPFPSPTISFSGPLSICSGSAAVLSVSGANSYSWSNGVSSSSITVTPSITTTYSVVGYVNGCSSNQIVQTLTVLATPTIVSTQGWMCNGSSYTISPTGASSYTYSSGTNIVSPTVTTVYTISGTNTVGCVGSTSTTINVQTCGQSGSSLSFDGLNDAVNTTAGYNFGSSWTYECWVKSPNAPVNNNGYDGPMYGANMGIVWNHATASYMGAATVQSADLAYNATGFGTLSSNTWYHLAATYDGTVLCAYKNGVLSSSITTTGGLATSTGSLIIGRHPSQAHFWEGTIDEARIWSTARTCSEINQLMNTELTGNEAGLYAYYNFNEGVPTGNNTSITSILDHSTHGYNGSLAGFALTGNNSNFFLGSPFDAPANNCGIVTGIHIQNDEANVSIYPNPANDYLNVTVNGQKTISVINVLGEEVLKETINEKTTLYINNLNSGIYFIKDETSGKAIKFIKR